MIVIVTEIYIFMLFIIFKCEWLHINYIGFNSCFSLNYQMRIILKSFKRNVKMIYVYGTSLFSNTNQKCVS